MSLLCFEWYFSKHNIKLPRKCRGFKGDGQSPCLKPSFSEEMIQLCFEWYFSKHNIKLPRKCRGFKGDGQSPCYHFVLFLTLIETALRFFVLEGSYCSPSSSEPISLEMSQNSFEPNLKLGLFSALYQKI